MSSRDVRIVCPRPNTQAHSEWHIGSYKEIPSVLLKFHELAWEFANILQQWLVTRKMIICSCCQFWNDLEI